MAPRVVVVVVVARATRPPGTAEDVRRGALGAAGEGGRGRQRERGGGRRREAVGAGVVVRVVEEAFHDRIVHADGGGTVVGRHVDCCFVVHVHAHADLHVDR